LKAMIGTPSCSANASEHRAERGADRRHERRSRDRAIAGVAEEAQYALDALEPMHVDVEASPGVLTSQA
jgi:hypothetical protein